jgi:hypothetical protein
MPVLQIFPFDPWRLKFFHGESPRNYFMGFVEVNEDTLRWSYLV